MLFELTTVINPILVEGYPGFLKTKHNHSNNHNINNREPLHYRLTNTP